MLCILFIYAVSTCAIVIMTHVPVIKGTTLLLIDIVVLMKALIVIICTLHINPLLNTTGDCDSGNYKSVVR